MYFGFVPTVPIVLYECECLSQDMQLLNALLCLHIGDGKEGEKVGEVWICPGGWRVKNPLLFLGNPRRDLSLLSPQPALQDGPLGCPERESLLSCARYHGVCHF